MAATFQWGERNGAGETETLDRAEANWKSIDDSTTAYSSAPIVDGTNSFDKYIYGKFSGTFASITAGLVSHTAGTMGTGLTIKTMPAMTVDADRDIYATPSETANAGCTVDMTATLAIGSGRDVWFGITSPGAAGKQVTETTNPCYTNFLTHQLQTSGASGGDTAEATITLRYDEN